MPLEYILNVGQAVIDSIEPDELSDPTLTKLQAIFSEKTVIAALDVIDRGKAWGHSEYQVMGSTGTYTVFLDLKNTKIPHSCTCPAFMTSVLMSSTHIMCKHILATMIACKMKLCIDRPCNADDLAALYSRQFTLSENND